MINRDIPTLSLLSPPRQAAITLEFLCETLSYIAWQIRNWKQDTSVPNHTAMTITTPVKKAVSVLDFSVERQGAGRDGDLSFYLFKPKSFACANPYESFSRKESKLMRWRRREQLLAGICGWGLGAAQRTQDAPQTLRAPPCPFLEVHCPGLGLGLRVSRSANWLCMWPSTGS